MRGAETEKAHLSPFTHTLKKIQTHHVRGGGRKVGRRAGGRGGGPGGVEVGLMMRAG